MSVLQLSWAIKAILLREPIDSVAASSSGGSLFDMDIRHRHGCA